MKETPNSILTYILQGREGTTTGVPFGTLTILGKVRQLITPLKPLPSFDQLRHINKKEKCTVEHSTV